MAEIINLRRARRARARQTASEQAAEARVRHGVAPVEHRAANADHERAVRRLDAAILTTPRSDERADT